MANPLNKSTDGGSSRRIPTIQFLVAMLAVCLPLATAGWLTDLRGVFHGLVLVLSVAAFLPLLLALAFILLVVTVGVVSVLAGDSDTAPAAAEAFAGSEALSAYRRRFLLPYYRFLFTRRHPALLGAACGLLLGTLLVGLLLSLLVVPGEVCTLKRMAAVEAALRKHHAYPAPVEGRWADAALLPESPPGWPYCEVEATTAGAAASILLDGFGRKLTYEVSGHWPIGTYRLASLGYDGRPSSDDLCISGGTRLRAAMDGLKSAAEIVHDLLAGPAERGKLHDWWAAVRSTSCPPDTRRTH